MKPGKGILNSSLYNLAGSVLPLAVAVFAIPIIIQGYGKEKFGIISLAWVFIGYFSIADFGISRALTKFASEKIGQDKTEELPSLIWTALVLMTTLGIFGGFLLALLSPILVSSLLKIDHSNSKEMLSCFYILSIGIPFTITTAGLRGVVEAFMRFDLSSYVRMALGVTNFIGPVLVLPYSTNIRYVILILVISRVLCALVFLGICFNVLPELKNRFVFHSVHVRPLLKYGGWITVSNIISPIMVNFDRFLIGAMVSVASLAYYVTPWEITARFLLVPSALAGVIFPLFSQARSYEDRSTAYLYRRSIRYVAVVMYPICLLAIYFSREILSIWLGSEYAQHSSLIMQIMAIAVLFNGLAAIPFAYIQASGKPDITAKFHILEIIFYIPILWLLINKWGIIGAAIAWLLRAGLDMLLLAIYSTRMVPLRPHSGMAKITKFWGPIIVVMSAALVLPFFIRGLHNRILLALVILALYVFTLKRKRYGESDRSASVS